MNNVFERQPGTYTSEEKLFALLSHLSILIGGVLLPIIIWATQKDKSKFVAFNALQAIFYQLSYITLTMIIVIVFFIAYVFLGVGAGIFFIGEIPDFAPLISILIMVGLMICYAAIFIIILGFVGYAIFIGIKSYQGELRKYPIIGNIIYNRIYNKPH